MTYMILEHDNLDGLQYKVNQYMEHGFIPVGGPFYNPEDKTWCQALYKKDSE